MPGLCPVGLPQSALRRMSAKSEATVDSRSLADSMRMLAIAADRILD